MCEISLYNWGLPIHIVNWGLPIHTVNWRLPIHTVNWGLLMHNFHRINGTLRWLVSCCAFDEEQSLCFNVCTQSINYNSSCDNQVLSYFLLLYTMRLLLLSYVICIYMYIYIYTQIYRCVLSTLDKHKFCSCTRKEIKVR